MTMLASIRAARLGEPQLQPDGSAVQEFRFPASDAVFAGHFPGHPLLPGIFQIEMTRELAESVLGGKLVVRAVTKAKFLRPIIPGETVRVELKSTAKADTIQLRARFTVIGQAAGEVMLEVARAT
jgi:3-hydroxyacyl-[acyl-carrier-protein] dehydratase